MKESVKNIVANAEKMCFLENYFKSTKAQKRLGVFAEPLRQIVEVYVKEYPQIYKLETKLPRLKARYLTAEKISKEDVSAGWQTTFLLTKNGDPCESYSIAIEADNGDEMQLPESGRNKILSPNEIEELLELESQDIWVESLSQKGKKYYGNAPYGLSEKQREKLIDVRADHLDKLLPQDYANLLKMVFIQRKSQQNKQNRCQQMLYKMDRQKTLCHETTHFLSCAEQKLFDANGNELPMYFFGSNEVAGGYVLESYGGVAFSNFPLDETGNFVVDATGEVVSQQVCDMNYYLHEAMTEFITMKMVDKLDVKYNGEKLCYTDEVKETLLSYRLFEICVEMFDAINSGEFEQSYFTGKKVELANLNENFYNFFDNLFENMDNLENSYANFCEESTAYNKLCFYDNFRQTMFETRSLLAKNMVDVTDLFGGGHINKKQLENYLQAQNKFITPLQWISHVCYEDELDYDIERALKGMVHEHLNEFKSKNTLSETENAKKICKHTKKYLSENNKEKFQTIFSLKTLKLKNEEKKTQNCLVK